MLALDARVGHWRKSARSTNNANCVEITFTGRAVGVRDSKCATGPVLVLPVGSFTNLLTCLR